MLTTSTSPQLSLSIPFASHRRSELGIRRKVTHFSIRVEFNELAWNVSRRYDEFKGLHRALVAKIPALSSMQAPKRAQSSLFSQQNALVTDKQRMQLEAYLQDMLQKDDVAMDVLFLEFIGACSTSPHFPLSETKSVKKILHLRSLENTLAPGDILLFSCKFSVSAMTRAVTLSDYDHVAVVVPGHSPGLLRLLEATSSGVHLYALKPRVLAYSKDITNSIVVRRITGERTPVMKRRLKEFAEALDGNSYSLLGLLNERGGSTRRRKKDPLTAIEAANDKLEKATSPSNLDQTVPRLSATEIGESAGETEEDTDLVAPTKVKKSKRKYFCSSLVASALKHIGWLQTSHSCAHFWPSSFADGGEIENLLIEDVSIGAETIIDCRVAEIGLSI